MVKTCEFIFILGVFLWFCINEIDCRKRFRLHHVICNSDAECRNNEFCYGYTSTKSGYCKCYEGYVTYRNTTFSDDCLPSRQLGESCDKSYECQNSGKLAECINNICECNETSHPFDNYCYSNSKLGESCSEDANCQFNSSSTAICIQNLCVCPEGYQRTEDGNSCIHRILLKLGAPCKMINDCLHIENAICSNVCKCDTSYVMSRDGKNCLKAAISFNDTCTEDAQCDKFLERSICQVGHCGCVEGFHQFERRCLEITQVDGVKQGKLMKILTINKSSNHFNLYKLLIIFLSCSFLIIVI